MIWIHPKKGDDVVYQRVCDDGGVISLDWSVNLDLGEGHGLDTTMLLVSGTPQGSGGKDVKLFVGKTIKRDVFRLLKILEVLLVLHLLPQG